MVNVFENEIRTALKNSKGLWFTKMFDDSRHFIKQPFDFLALGMNTNYAIECKCTQSKSLSFANIPEHQEKGLLYFKDKLVVNQAFIAINLLRKNRKCGRAFLVDINLYFGYKRTISRKSLPLSWIEKNGIELKRVKLKGVYFWDLESLLL